MGVRSTLESVDGWFTLDQNPEPHPGMAALLSLVVPGLGQVFLGQWARGVRLFIGSAVLLFGFGLCNVVVAYDAYSIGTRLKTEPIPTDASSKTLWAFGAAWAVAGWVTRKFFEALRDAPGPLGLFGLPLVIHDVLVYGKGGKA